MMKKYKVGNYEFTEKEFSGKKEISGSLYLRSLTSIPEGFNPTAQARWQYRYLEADLNRCGVNGDRSFNWIEPCREQEVSGSSPDFPRQRR